MIKARVSLNTFLINLSFHFRILAWKYDMLASPGFDCIEVCDFNDRDENKNDDSSLDNENDENNDVDKH